MIDWHSILDAYNTFAMIVGGYTIGSWCGKKLTLRAKKRDLGSKKPVSLGLISLLVNRARDLGISVTWKKGQEKPAYYMSWNKTIRIYIDRDLENGVLTPGDVCLDNLISLAHEIGHAIVGNERGAAYDTLQSKLRGRQASSATEPADQMEIMSDEIAAWLAAEKLLKETTFDDWPVFWQQAYKKCGTYWSPR